MRRIHNAERKQRGCNYCAHAIPPEQDGRSYKCRACPFDECPYHELDEVKSYSHYLKRYGDLTLGALLLSLK